jgi:hypothetical protein
LAGAIGRTAVGFRILAWRASNLTLLHRLHPYGMIDFLRPITWRDPMWMQQPALYEAEGPDGPTIFPPDRCCNCGSREDIRPERVTLVRSIRAFDARATIALPACPTCRVTMHRQSPSVVLRFFWAFVWSAIAITLIVAGIMQIGWKPPIATFGYLYAGCLVLAIAGMSAYYAGLRPRGAQTCFWQPVRLRGIVARDGARTLQLACTNPEIATSLAGFTRAVVPSARVVRS